MTQDAQALANDSEAESSALEAELETRLRELNEIRDSLLTAFSHQLRTPLTVILGSIELLEKSGEQLSAEMRADFRERIRANVDRVNRLLLDLLRVGATRPVVNEHPRRVDVGRLTLEAVAASGIDATHTVETRTPSVDLACFPGAVRQAIDNLLKNVQEHTPAGTGVLVEVGRADGDGALVCVSDSGPGVPAELHEKVFEPFRRGPVVPEHSPGVGVGLSVVGRVADLHAGRAWVEDRAGGGARFCLLLHDVHIDEEDEAARSIPRLLQFARAHLGMEVAFLGEFTAEGEAFRAVEGDVEIAGIAEGEVMPLGETYCELMLTGQIDNAVPDTRNVPVLASRPVTADIGSYVGVPIVLSTGRVYGALCCVSPSARDEISPRDVQTMQLLSALVADTLEK